MTEVVKEESITDIAQYYAVLRVSDKPAAPKDKTNFIVTTRNGKIMNIAWHSVSSHTDKELSNRDLCFLNDLMEYLSEKEGYTL